MSYIGIPPFGQTVRTVTTITASASQTLFTPNGGYTVGYVDVYYNGIKLVAGVDFTASNGTTVTLTAGAIANAVIEIVAYGSVSLADSVRRSGDTFSGTVNFPNNNIIAANGNVGIGNNIPNAPLVVGSASGSFTNPLIQAAGNANSWIQINGQNLNNGNNASTDLVLSRSDGNDTAGYIDVGINSNTYAQAAYSIMTPRSGYVFTNGGDLVLGTQTAHNVLFHTGNTTSASERMRISTDGAIDVKYGGATNMVSFGGTGTVNGITGLPSTVGTPLVVGRDTGSTRSAHFAGNLKFTSGYGIDFSDSSNTAGMTGEVLNDYEEGTFTPTIYGSSTAGTGTYGYQNGVYTKIGNIVAFSCYVQVTSHTGTGNMHLAGLPFASRVQGGGTPLLTPCASYNYSMSLTAGNYFQCYVNHNGSSSVIFEQIPTGGGAGAYIPLDTSFYIGLSGSYQTA